MKDVWLALVATVELVMLAALLLAGWLLGRWVGLLLAVLLALAAVFAVSVRFFRYALCRTRHPYGYDAHPELHRSREQVEAENRDIEDRRRERLQAFGADNLEIVSHDGLRLRAMLVHGETGERRVAVVVHGHQCKSMDMFDWALHYRQTYGMNVLLADARGHGRSEGRYVGMGWPERLDYSRWFDVLIQRFGPDTRILMHGLSMGGATVMMTAGEDLPENVKLFVEDCGYTGIREEFTYQLHHGYHLPAWPVLVATNLLCRLLAGYGYWQASSVAQLRKCRKPMLFIHGDQDTYVPYAMAKPCFEQAACVDKELLSIPGAAHARAMDVDPQRVWDSVDRFVQTYMPKEEDWPQADAMRLP